MLNWKEISTLDQWKEVLEQSDQRGKIILKHSTTCPVSANALGEYEQYIKESHTEDIDFYLVKVFESRHVSNQITHDLDVKHESPQIIYVNNKEKFWTTSHWSITKEHIAAVLN